MNRRQFFTKGLIGGLVASVLNPAYTPAEAAGREFAGAVTIYAPGGFLTRCHFERGVKVIGDGLTISNSIIKNLDDGIAIEVGQCERAAVHFNE